MDQKRKETPPAPFVEGERIYLRGVCLSDIDEDYCRWMNDDEVTRYLESRFYPHSVESIAAYVSRVNESPDSVFLAIVVKDKNVRIGNIKIGPINWIHRYADVGIMIGEKAYWGQGLATEAIRLLVDYAFKKLNLNRLEAGCYANNLASIRAFQKAGFVEEGRLKQRYFWNGEYVDRICLGIIRGN